MPKRNQNIPYLNHDRKVYWLLDKRTIANQRARIMEEDFYRLKNKKCSYSVLPEAHLSLPSISMSGSVCRCLVFGKRNNSIEMKGKFQSDQYVLCIKVLHWL